MLRSVLSLAVIVLGVPTVLAVRAHGYAGIFRQQLASWGGIQVLLDLAIALALVLVWLWRDARARGSSPWPWVALTLAAGSFGPLLYLLTRSPGDPPRV